MNIVQLADCIICFFGVIMGISLPNKLIEPRGHTADQQFQIFFFQNRTFDGLEPQNAKFYGGWAARSAPKSDVKNRHRDP